MVFQAVAEYRTQVKDRQNFNMDVELSVAGRSRPVKYTIKRDNVHLTRSDKVKSVKWFLLLFFNRFLFYMGFFVCLSYIIFNCFLVNETFRYLYYHGFDYSDNICVHSTGGHKQRLQCDG